MGTLKEVKARIRSVRGTQKITSAMHRVASAKLHHAQNTLGSVFPCARRLEHMLSVVSAALPTEVENPYTTRREVSRVAIVAFGSDTGLCGAYNAHIEKTLHALVGQQAGLGQEAIRLFALGRRMEQVAGRLKIPLADDESIPRSGTPSWDDAVQLTDRLMTWFRDGEADRVVLVYQPFTSSTSAGVAVEEFLPMQVEHQVDADDAADYLFEPSAHELADRLLPQTLRTRLYVAWLQAQASEQRARMLAMQAATDNADHLLQDLAVLHHKTRQQAITNELLDLMGGSLR